MKAGQTPCQKYWHKLLDMIESGKLNPQVVISHEGPLDAAPHLYKLFNDKQEDCVKVIPKLAVGIATALFTLPTTGFMRAHECVLCCLVLHSCALHQKLCLLGGPACYITP